MNAVGFRSSRFGPPEIRLSTHRRQLGFGVGGMYVCRDNLELRIIIMHCRRLMDSDEEEERLLREGQAELAQFILSVEVTAVATAVGVIT